MKKLLGISVIAMLAVSPMMANAAANGTVEGVTITAETTARDSANVASAQYVKEAYNAMATEVTNELGGKQDVITDLETIRSDAAAGAGVAATYTTDMAGKQDVISDLANIRSGAAAGATALQSNSALNGANLTAGTVAETALDTTLQNKIDNAAAVAANAATREGVVSTINHSTASTGITLYSGWNSGNAPTPNAQPTNFSGTVTSPATNAYYGTVAAQSGTTQPETAQQGA